MINQAFITFYAVQPSIILHWLKVRMYLKIYRKVCLKMAKKDQLQAIALMRRKINFEGFPENGMATSHVFWKFYLIALTVIIPVLLQNKI